MGHVARLPVVAARRTGVLLLHGFTGSPGSLGPLPAVLERAGHEVSVPCLPGHGTVVEDMLPTRWEDWSGAAEAAYRDLAARVERVAVAGQSMGGTLTCWLAARHPEIAAIACVNPLVLPRSDDELHFVDELLAAGEEVVEAVSADLADPDAVEPAYDVTPLAALRSLLGAVQALQDDLVAIRCPLLLLTSAEDHVVDPLNSDHLASAVGGPVERLRLERSFHVATLDHDRDLVAGAIRDFVDRTFVA